MLHAEVPWDFFIELKIIMENQHEYYGERATKKYN